MSGARSSTSTASPASRRSRWRGAARKPSAWQNALIDPETYVHDYVDIFLGGARA